MVVQMRLTAVSAIYRLFAYMYSSVLLTNYDYTSFKRRFNTLLLSY